VKDLACAIVGGGPSGISTALFLAAAAPELKSRIVVLEKERYPREKFCAGAVGRRGDLCLSSIGVRVDVPAVPINGIEIRTGGGSRVVRESNVGRVVRRIEFDHELARVAMERGISVREGVRATAIDVTSSGVTIRTSEGDLRAAVVVGADGVGSFVRRAAGFAATPYLAQALEVDTEYVDGDGERDVIAFDLRRQELRGYYWDFPSRTEGRDVMCRGVYLLRERDHRGPDPEIDDVLQTELAARGLSLSSYKKKRYAERGFHFAGPAAAARVLLVGEAAGIDPVTGEGIAQALQYGSAAGRYLARKLRAGNVDFGDWTAFLRRTSVGRDLRVRTALVDLAYGARRPGIERFLVDTPDFLRIGLQHFGGARWSKRALARAAGSALTATMRSFLRD
jgi:flavin-dependent dehydrogenase